MIEKKFEDIQEGMIVADDILDAQLKVIAIKGTVIDDACITALKAASVASVKIDDDTRFVGEFRAIDERVDAKFKEHAGDSVLQHIAAIAKHYLKARLKKGLR